MRPKFACAACERVVEAPAPSRPIERGLAGPALLAHVLVSKYCDHQPLYRQSEIYARQGVEIERSTLAGWVGASSALLDPLVDALREHVLAGRKIHADDTPMPVLAPGTGKTKTGRLWTYVRDDRPAGEKTTPAVWFAYSEDRKGEHPRAHLKNFKGALQADAYSGFHHLYEGGAIYEVACWAHARRKFYEIHAAHPSPITTEALDRIGALYGIEEEIRGKPVDLRRQVRQSRARPLLDDFRVWMEKSLRQLSPKSETAAAIRYALSRWRALIRYVDDGLLEIDNNAGRASVALCGPGKEKLSLCRCRFGRRAGCHHLFVNRLGQAQWPRSRTLPAHGARSNRRSSDQSHRRTTTLECSRLIPVRQPSCLKSINHRCMKCPLKNKWTLRSSCKSLSRDRNPR